MPAKIAGQGITNIKPSIAQGFIIIYINKMPDTAPDAPMLAKPELFLFFMYVGILARTIISMYDSIYIVRPAVGPRRDIM